MATTGENSKLTRIEPLWRKRAGTAAICTHDLPLRYDRLYQVHMPKRVVRGFLYFSTTCLSITSRNGLEELNNRTNQQRIALIGPSVYPA